MKQETRLFFVVDSREDNEEIFATLEEAEKFYEVSNEENKPRLYIAIVKHAYYENDIKAWNYEDLSNTFEIIKMLKE